MNRRRKRKMHRITKKLQKLVISKAALKLAKENNIDLEEITPTGSKGNIILKDVKAFLKSKDN